MPKKDHTTEQIIGLLRQSEVEMAQGQTVGEICWGAVAWIRPMALQGGST
jgi:hypothetical protein